MTVAQTEVRWQLVDIIEDSAFLSLSLCLSSCWVCCKQIGMGVQSRLLARTQGQREPVPGKSQNVIEAPACCQAVVGTLDLTLGARAPWRNPTLTTFDGWVEGTHKGSEMFTFRLAALRSTMASTVTSDKVVLLSWL